jgi:hypothetical protein
MTIKIKEQMCYNCHYSTMSLKTQGDFVTMLSNGSLTSTISGIPLSLNFFRISAIIFSLGSPVMGKLQVVWAKTEWF